VRVRVYMREVVTWSLVLLCAGLLCHATASFLFGEHPHMVARGAFHLVPLSGAFDHLCIVVYRRDAGPQAVAHAVALIIDSETEKGHVRIELPGLQWRYWEQGRWKAKETPVDADALLKWMGSSHITDDAAELHEEADELAKIIHDLAEGSSLTAATRELADFRVEEVTIYRPGWPVLSPKWAYAEAGFFGFMWLLGLVYIRHSRATQIPHQTASDP